MARQWTSAGELLALRWKDVDLERGVLAVTGSLQVDRRVPRDLPTPVVDAVAVAHAALSVAVDLLTGEVVPDVGPSFA